MRTLVFLMVLATPAQADVLKYALVVANNRGDATEADLRYAHADALRIKSVLERYGGVRAENSTVMLEKSADEVRSAIVTLNDRIRRDVRDRDVLLFVYYSGHADSDALHLGGTSLSIEELRKMVRGSAAKFRLLVLDACKSGALTRVKGGKVADAFDIDIEHELSSEGTVFITSSASSEDSQESDAIEGSFFTHYLASGLLGAADASDDRKVSLTEAYRYAHDQTVKATSRTWAGTQHPTFQYDLRGKGDLVLVDLSAGKTALVFGHAGEYLVFRGDRIVAEVVTERPGRRLLLEPGTYFVRERRKEELREGTIVIAEGAEPVLDTSSFQRIQYARLVRKGALDLAHGPMAYYRYRGEILDGLGGVHGLGVGYSFALPWLTLSPRVGFGMSGAANATLSSSTREVDIVLEATKAIDVGRVSLAAGLEAGGAWIAQSFATKGSAPDRDALAFVFGGVGTASFDLGAGLWLFARVEALSYVLPLQGEGTVTPLTWAAGGGLGFTL